MTATHLHCCDAVLLCCRQVEATNAVAQLVQYGALAEPMMRIMSEFGEIVNRYDQRRQVAQATEDVAKEEAKKPLEEQLPDAKLFKPRKKGRRSLTEEELQALQRREDAVANKERRARQAAFGKAGGGVM